ncbi:MAG: permease [Anaerolineaceae bacterium]|nr:MAG: permease [Anaerolineaceae bacterium]
MNDLVAIGQFVGTAVWNVWPLFLVSILLSVLIRALKLDGVIRRAFNANVGTAILLATLVGAFSPFCSCTVVPVIAGLLLSGVPLAPIMSFWIASPTMDPEIFTLSVGILGWPLALARLAATLALSLAAGYITLALTNTSLFGHFRPGKQQQRDTAVSPPPSEAGVIIPLTLATAAIPTGRSSASLNVPSVTLTTGGRRAARATGWRHQLATSFRQIEWPEFGREVARQSWSLGRWLLLAFLMEALITLYVPQETIATILGEGNVFAVPLAALIGIPLYLSNFTALPIVSGLLAQGMQSGAAIAFLVAGPVTTVPAMTAVYGVVQKRVFVLYLSLGLFGAMVMGVVANLLLG